MAITWTKEWMASDDGTVFSGLDLKNIQDDITSGSTGDASSIWSVPVIQPTAAEDGKVLFYDHATPSFDYIAASSVVLPTGIILLWSGAISAIPTGWTICDGTAGTPNLTDRFVIHADSDSGGTNDVGDSGGVSSHTLTGAESGTSAHGHPFRYSTAGAGGTQYAQDPLGPLTTYDTTATASVANSTSASAVSAHTNRDKHYALAYIMKT